MCVRQTVAVNLVERDLRIIQVVEWPYPHPVNRAVISHQLGHLHRADVDEFLAQPLRIVRIGKGPGLDKIIHGTWRAWLDLRDGLFLLGRIGSLLHGSAS